MAVKGVLVAGAAISIAVDPVFAMRLSAGWFAGELFVHRPGQPFLGRVVFTMGNNKIYSIDAVKDGERCLSAGLLTANVGKTHCSARLGPGANSSWIGFPMLGRFWDLYGQFSTLGSLSGS